MPCNFPELINKRNEKNEEDITKTFFFILANVPFTSKTLKMFCRDKLFCSNCVYFGEDICERCGKVMINLWDSDNIIDETIIENEPIETTVHEIV